MTSGSLNFSSGPTIDTLSWGGEDDPEHKKINPFSKTRNFIYNPSAPLLYAGSFYMNVTVPGGWWLWTADDEQRLGFALASAVARKVRGHDFNLGTTLAECRESFAMISGAARGVSDILSGIGRSAKKRGLKRGDTQAYIQSKWLEYRYGWMPLLSDAYNAAEAAASLLRDPTDWVSAGAKRSAPLEWSSPIFGGSFLQGEGTRSKLVHCRLKGDLSLADHFGLDNPLSIAWELIPYSFVVDWFMPIGEYLETRGTLMSASNVEAFINVRSFIRKNTVTYDTERWSGVHPYRKLYYAFSRSPISLPSLIPAMPPLADFSDVFKGDRGVKRVLDSIALLAQRVKILRLL